MVQVNQVYAHFCSFTKCNSSILIAILSSHQREITNQWNHPQQSVVRTKACVHCGSHILFTLSTLPLCVISRPKATWLENVDLRLLNGIAFRKYPDPAQRWDCVKRSRLVASIILKWKKFGTTRTLPKPGQTEYSREKGLDKRWPGIWWLLWPSSIDPEWRWEKPPDWHPLRVLYWSGTNLYCPICIV